VEYFGLDVHKQYTVFTHVDKAGILLGQGRIDNAPDSLEAMLRRAGSKTRVVLEAGGIWPVFADALENLGAEVVLAHPLRTRAIAAARVKTDRIDSAILAHLLRTDLIPQAYLAPPPVRELRELLRYRIGLVRLQTIVKNRIHALLAIRGQRSPFTDLFGRAGREWLKEVELPHVARRCLTGQLAVLDSIQEQIKLANAEVRRRARQSCDAKRLRTIPGVGAFSALLILAEVGEIQRFPDAKHLVSYAGLAPSVHSTGGHTRYRHITKQGSPWLRWILVEAAIAASSRPGALRDRYRSLARRKGAKTARVALARHLATIVYHVLAGAEGFRAAQSELLDQPA
jgi:transposase